jgi:hypothetical protein
MHPPVLTKKDFVRRYALGEFGNHSPTWDTFREWLGSNPLASSLYHIRNRIAGGKTWYNVPALRMGEVWRAASEEVGIANLYISAMAPTEKTVFQGEVQRGLWGLDVYYSTVAKPMREALAESSSSVSGLNADLLLRRYLNQKSYDWLMYLLDEFPSHVVEFSTYSVNWGTVEGHNTIFWETRLY